MPPLDRPRNLVRFYFDATTLDFGVAVLGAVRVHPIHCASNTALCAFVLRHEQGHHELGSSEQAADCYGARNAPTEAVEAALAYFTMRPFSGDTSHGSGAARAAVIARCFAGRMSVTHAIRSSFYERGSWATKHSLAPEARCRRDASNEYRACVSDCRQSDDDTEDFRSCTSECRDDFDEELSACNSS
ncbi:MAG: hypothetical protein IT348_20230 [Candidatus Eisenbacteria bacterium]|nr:hypothetical protein [Candidatus Eisenbacteria bacterium]